MVGVAGAGRALALFGQPRVLVDAAGVDGA